MTSARTRRTNRRWRTALVGIALVATVAAACSSDGDADDAGAGTTSTTTSTSAPATGTSTTTTTTAPPIDLTTRPPSPSSPDEVAATIVRVETQVRNLSVSGDALARAAHEQQLAYRTLGDHPEWDAAVRSKLPTELQRVAFDNVEANRQLRSLVARPRDTMPAWRIVEARPADELRRYYEEGEATYGVPWEYLAAVNLTETRMGRLRGTSTAGAQGPMQFIPSTWAAYGRGDINSDHDAILAAARYLAANGGGSGNIDNALYRYNPTAKYVEAVKRYAGLMIDDERAYRGYYGWQVYYWTTLGDAWLPVGYEATASRPVAPTDVDADGAEGSG